jgi:hypothetical protein
MVRGSRFGNTELPVRSEAWLLHWLGFSGSTSHIHSRGKPVEVETTITVIFN